MKTMKKHTAIKAFTLAELLIAVAMLAIIIAVGIPALGQSRVDSTVSANEQTAKTLNDAITRAIIDGATDPVLTGNDVDAARDWLLINGYMRP